MIRESYPMYCPNPRCEAGWFEVERVGTGYGALWIEVDEQGVEWKVVAPEPVCPRCGWPLLARGESLGAEAYLEWRDRNAA